MPGCKKAILVTALLLLISLLTANLRKEFVALEKAYQEGKMNDLAAQMLNLKAKSDEEKSLLLFMSGVLKSKHSDCIAQLQLAIERHPNTFYGQLSMLHRAKLHVLNRETAEARVLLNRINSAQISERLYWLAVCAEMNDEHASVVSNAEAYLRLEPNGSFAEESYYQIANAYIQQKKYQSAQSTLNQLKNPKDSQYYHYLKGQAYHLSGNWQEALLNYKSAIDVSRYTQLAYQIEDRLFELKETYRSKVDLGFLFPYADLQILIEEDTPETTSPTPAVGLPAPATDAPLRLSAKPSKGLYLQAGRFGIEANARSVAYRIRQLNLPSGYYEDKGNKSVPWVAISGPFENTQQQQSAMQLLKSSQIDCFTIKY